MNELLLSIKGITKWYGHSRVLNDVSFDLYAGEVVSLLGVNGAGKTTLSSILATLRPPTSGDVLYHGTSIYQDIPEFRRLIGYCPQKPNLNPLLTLRDNLFFAGKYFGMSDEQIEARMHELNNRVGINKYLNAYPSELSGGWKQRYLIARALMHSPRLVILDEPTVALDPSVRYQLWNYISHIASEGVCVLLTTHYIEEAEQLSDRIILLDKGEVKLIDTPQNLMNQFKQENLESVFVHLTQEAAKEEQE